MKLRKHLTALLVLLSASGWGIIGSNQVRAAAKTAPGNMNLAAAYPAANPGAMPGEPSGSEAWGKYEDPLEQAFTLDVPRGWTVKGGLFRMGYSDVRVMVDMTSPDGRINMRVGDVAIPIYAPPNQFHQEGGIIDLGAQAQERVARYRSGQDFAKAYSNARFARVCQNLRPQSSSLPPIVKGNTPHEAIQWSEGDVSLACGGPQGERTAYVYAQTALKGNYWKVTNLLSYVAPQGQAALAQELLAHSSKSLQVSPVWAQKQTEEEQEALVYQRERQQQRIKGLSAQMKQFESNMQGMREQVNAFERGQEQRNIAFHQVDNIVSGITPSVDPYGNVVNVMNGPKSRNWFNASTRQQINSDNWPGPGWEEVTPLP